MSSSGAGNPLFVENTIGQYVLLDVLKNNAKESWV